MSRWRGVAIGVAAYLLVGALWILFSAALLRMLVKGPQQLLAYQTAKAWVYLILTAAFFGWLLRRNARARHERAHAERELRDMVRNAGVGIAQTGFDGRIRSVNPHLCAIFGYTRTQMLRLSIADLLQPASAALANQKVAAAMRGELERYDVEPVGVHADGSALSLLVNVTVMRDEAGRPSHFVSVVQDLTGSRSAESQLRLAAAVIHSTSEAVVITDPQRRVLSVNPAFSRLFGYAEDEMRGRSAKLLRSNRHGAEFFDRLFDEVERESHWRGEVWSRSKDGTLTPALVSVNALRDPAGTLTHYVAMFADIGLQKESEAKLDFLAHHDALTALPNRMAFQLELEEVLAAAERRGERAAVLLLDIDRFKDINDSFGHHTGDQLLQHVARSLKKELRPGDVLARLGGDEFALLLRDLGPDEDAARVARRLMQGAAQPWRSDGGIELTAGISVGVSLFPRDGSTTSALLQGADAALYQAKADGRGIYRYFTEDMTAAARERIELEVRLRRAVVDKLLVLHYQPQVEIATGRIVGAEALLRWTDPQEGPISPTRFIPVAEATGLIGPIGHWVMGEACRQGRLWLDAGLPPLVIAVNVSPRQFHLSDIVGQAMQVLRETGFPHRCLELEITEGALMEREQEALDTLAQLRGLGVRIAVDDFGTGYSSLAKLKRFKIDVLKIDRSFIAEIPHRADDMAISAAIIAMGRGLGVQVLAEGVETQEQLNFLRERGCDSYQGYFRSPPVPAEAFEALLREQHGAGLRLSEPGKPP